MKSLSRETPLETVTDVIDASLPHFTSELVSSAFLFKDADPVDIMRTPHCGPLSALVVDELLQHGIESQLLHADIRDLRAGHGDQSVHCQCQFWADGQVYRLDATYAQFFSRFGLDFRHDQFYRTSASDFDTNPRRHAVFPDENYLILARGAEHDAARWAGSVVRIFWQRHGYELGQQVAYSYTRPNDGLSWLPLLRRMPSLSDVEEYFTEVLSEDRYKPKEIPEQLQEVIGYHSIRSSIT